MIHKSFQKKSSHCQQQAINTLQNIFPSVNLQQFTKHSSIWEVLQKSAKNVPRPGLGDITSAISNMKTVVDSQQLKIQKNMIEIQECQQIIMSSTKSYSSRCNIDRPAIKLNFDNEMQDQSQEIIKHEEAIDTYEKYEIKNEFFSQHEEIDYFQNNHQQIKHYDDEQDVKKYLSFDF